MRWWENPISVPLLRSPVPLLRSPVPLRRSPVTPSGISGALKSTASHHHHHHHIPPPLSTTTTIAHLATSTQVSGPVPSRMLTQSQARSGTTTTARHVNHLLATLTASSPR